MKMGDDVRIDPWSSSQSTDYQRIIDQFGLQQFEYGSIEQPTHLHRRGIVFAHRDFQNIGNAQRNSLPHGVLTGLMPSGQMHLGHSMVVEQVRWFQQQGADVSIAVADLESQATRGIPLSKGYEVAIEEYIRNYAALGLDPDKTQVYFQSKRAVVQRLGFQLGKRTNLSEFESIYGFGGETNLAHVQAPMVQVGDILHPQLEEYGGLRPIVVPVGVDQDPHLRLTRGLASKSNWFNVKQANRGVLIGLSLQDDNADVFGMEANGRIDKQKVSDVFAMVHQKLTELGFSDIESIPKQGTIQVFSATTRDLHAIRMALLSIERRLGGMGLLAPSSTYHHFAVGLTGDKMSSSSPKSTIFLNDPIEVVQKKIMKAYSGGQPTIEEHRRLGGNPETDVAYQYLMYFFEQDDSHLEEIHTSYSSGQLLAGELKQLCADKATEWMNDLKEKRDETAHLVEQFIRHD
jgi:tryptophanyl-tRNA synthetase